MNTHKLMMVAFLSASALSVGLTGCAHESRAETRADVAEAQAEGQKDVADKLSDSAEANRELALAKAKADHKVAVERCETMIGSERYNCKHNAGVALEIAEAKAEADKLAAEPKD